MSKVQVLCIDVVQKIFYIGIMNKKLIFSLKKSKNNYNKTDDDKK